MTLTQQIITIAMCVLGTMATRFLPFIIFNEKGGLPNSYNISENSSHQPYSACSLSIV